MRQPSVTQHNFATVPAPTIQRSTFDRSHGHKTALNADYLYPIFVDEILPGDTVRMNATLFARLNTLLHPIMDNLHLEAFAFATPMRLLWSNWQKFMGEQNNPEDSIDYTIPRLYLEDSENIRFDSQTLFDYMGLPTEVNIPITGTNAEHISALFARNYNLTYNQWFRDQNLQASLPFTDGDGPDSRTLYNLVKRGKRHDYFTSALPWAQKGDPVYLPLGEMAPVVGDGTALGLTFGSGTNGLIGANINGTGATVGVLGIAQTAVGDPVGSTTIMPDTGWDSDGFVGGVTTNPASSGLRADLTMATAITVNDLRQAVAMQQLLEIYARGGTRYVELLKTEFGVTSPDFRLQRPEFISMSSTIVNINTIEQTSQSTEDSAVGELGGRGSVADRLSFSYSATEHMIIMILVNIRADITYQQMLPKMWSRRTRYDFYHPAFAMLGEQAVLGKELNFMDGMPSDYNQSVFGYQERYAEYRYKPSIITGKMKSNATGTLDPWHLSQDFGNNPVYLNDVFITSETPLERAIAVTAEEEPQFYFDSWFDYKHTRPMPVRSVPGLAKL